MARSEVWRPSQKKNEIFIFIQHIHECFYFLVDHHLLLLSHPDEVLSLNDIKVFRLFKMVVICQPAALAVTEKSKSDLRSLCF